MVGLCEGGNEHPGSLKAIGLYENGDWPEDFTKAVLLPVPKKNNAKKCDEFRTISLISHTAKILLQILNRRLYSKMEKQLEEEQFGFRKGKETWPLRRNEEELIEAFEMWMWRTMERVKWTDIIKNEIVLEREKCSKYHIREGAEIDQLITERGEEELAGVCRQDGKTPSSVVR
ncbi:hypothetical protein ANN_10460 [Periplaneta americana]|uniref:Reverse transcriptase domain-containing protein n=1 Tax=Periplaneta americana TaxID=6978 RepID=A0ABQ8TS83_PERAM|nr:hypothetical protein ANN_10460 [Periplaneta americana]